MYKYILTILIVGMLPAMAFDLDTSVDEEIRKNYNPSILEKSLPALPKTAPKQPTVGTSQSQNASKTTNASQIVKSVPITYASTDKKTAIRIKKGTKIKAKSNSYLSDATKVGTSFKFTTTAPIYQTYITIPVGTVFVAEVTDSHLPQITGNGGLLEIAVTGACISGVTYMADGKITKANHKKIFFNNIKGKHQYWKGVAKQVDKGQKFYNKTRNWASKLSQNPVTNLISPVPTVIGAGAYVINLIGSPILSIGSKGGRLSIPAGSDFELKLIDDVYISN